MAVDKKISQLASGAPAQAGDEYVVARSGANYKLTLTNIAASMPPIGATTPNTGSFTSLTNSGNLTFSSTGQRITGDMSNATLSNRLAFQTSTTNGNTIVGAFPNGTGTNTRLQLFSASDPANASTASMEANATSSLVIINADKTGTGTYLPMTFYTGGSERMRLDTSGNLGIGTASPLQRFNAVNTSITGGAPATSGSAADPNAVARLQAGSVALDIGVYAAGQMWLQPRSFTNYATNYDLVLQPNGGNVGIGVTPTANLDVKNAGGNCTISAQYGTGTKGQLIAANNEVQLKAFNGTNDVLTFATGASERMRISSSGNVGIGTTSANPIGDNTVGTVIFGSGAIAITRDSNPPLLVNRKTNDGNLVEFYQDGVLEGSISVAGNVVSYNPFMGSHYTEIVGAMPTLKGTVLESLDELVDGKYSSQDRLPKAKVSDTAGSSSVYGVYFSPDSNPDTNNGILAAALGASWVRIAAGVTVQRGDLLESNGDGCAKVQSDDIIRSKTIGKVTSTTVADTYPDGSYIVPCVLYCG